MVDGLEHQQAGSNTAEVMDITQHIVAYYKGERFEAMLLTAFGVVMLVIAVAMWSNLGQNQMLKGLFYPVAFLALFTLGAGGFNTYNNTQRLELLPAKYKADSAAFVQTEVGRFDGPNGVNTWWMPLKLTWAICVVVGMVLSFTTKRDLVNGVAIGLILIGAMGFIIDGFAHQRARVYAAVLTGQSST